jgi:hypothetical protein
MKETSQRYVEMKECICSFTVCLILFLFCSGPSHASQPESAAIVIAVRGEASAVDDSGNRRILTTKSPLFENDQLLTGKEGRIQIMFTDNTIISLGRQASLKISEYVYNKDQTGKLSTNVSEGVFRVMGGILTKTSPDNFKTLTPSGNIGIRGSMYTGRVAKGETVVVFEGGKGITFRNNTGLIDISQPGYGVRVAGVSSMVPQPYKFSSNDLRIFHDDLAVQRLKGVDGRDQAGERSFTVPVKFSANDVQKLKSASRDPADKKAGAGKKEKLQQELSKEQQGQEMAELTRQVKENPGEAAGLLQKAVEVKGLKIEDALGAAFKGMRNPTKEDFGRLQDQALELGITVEGAKELIEDLKKSGELCK